MMEIRTITKIALRAIEANKMRSVLTSLGIIIGVAAVIILLIAVISYSCAPLFMGYATNALTDIFTGASTYKEGHPFLKFLLLTKAVFICIIFILTAFLTLLLHL